METSINQKILNAEKNWLEELKLFLQELFSETFLPSHDHTHHIRTWNNAKIILREISEFNVSLSQDFVNAVILSSMFHDTGIIETRGIAHGRKSKSIYLKYIAENCDVPPAMHDKIAHAIEYHDQKTLNLFVPFHWNKPPDLLTVMSIADDMDAMGIIGIYRYAEIYLHRSTPLKSLGMVLMENVSVRYNNFSKACTLFPSLINKTKPLYQEIITFYDNYNQQILAETNPLKVYSGHIGIINYIRNFSIIGKINPMDFNQSLENFQLGKYVSDFFEKLETQLAIENK